MAFGISRNELRAWQTRVAAGEIAYLTHYWYDPRFPSVSSVTKVGCSDLVRLRQWCTANELDPRYIHRRMPYPHFDLMGSKQIELLEKAGLHEHIVRFGLHEG
ncbi:hypothetical protein [Paenibacillus lemnae]|uniref:Uncharacterized protein n=1 Tax=Paenibacillus lemnae TaxID=1330551 RepID=A0A848MCL8_PAELE|nr:hypothetical protein [Paenibacillus lemnae]NMO97782.1 hypothetical protein [Paenibacillus lemnae]